MSDLEEAISVIERLGPRACQAWLAAVAAGEQTDPPPLTGMAWGALEECLSLWSRQYDDAWAAAAIDLGDSWAAIYPEANDAAVQRARQRAMEIRFEQISAHGALRGDRYRDPATVLDWARDTLPASPEAMAASASACAAAYRAGERRTEDWLAILYAWRRVKVASAVLRCEGVDMQDDLRPWFELDEKWNPFVIA